MTAALQPAITALADAQRAENIRRHALALSDAIAEAVHGGLLVQVQAMPITFVGGRAVTLVEAAVSKPL